MGYEGDINTLSPPVIVPQRTLTTTQPLVLPNESLRKGFLFWYTFFTAHAANHSHLHMASHQSCTSTISCHETDWLGYVVRCNRCDCNRTRKRRSSMFPLPRPLRKILPPPPLRKEGSPHSRPFRSTTSKLKEPR